MFWVSSDLNSGQKVKSFSFSGGGVVLGKLRSELRKEKKVKSIFHFQDRKGGGKGCSG